LSKYTLDYEEEYDFELIGIASAVPGYKIAWHINKILDVSLKRIDDHVVSIESKVNIGEISFENPQGNSIRYSLYQYERWGGEVIYNLISLKSQGQVLSKELEVFDYLLKIENNQGLAQEHLKILQMAEPFNLVRLIEVENHDLDFMSTIL
jgi:hypothetical protein